MKLDLFKLSKQALVFIALFSFALSQATVTQITTAIQNAAIQNVKNKEVDLAIFLETRTLENDLGIQLKKAIAQKLQEFHNSGKVHKNLEPENIMVKTLKGKKIIVKLKKVGAKVFDGSKFSSGYASDYSNKLEFFTFLMLSKAFSQKSPEAIKKMNKPEVTASLKSIMVFNDDATINNIFNWAAAQLKEVDKKVREDFEDDFKDAWKNDKKWREVASKFLERYREIMADIFALGKVIKDIDEKVFGEAMPGSKVTKLYEVNPFKRPATKQVLKWLEEGKL